MRNIEEQIWNYLAGTCTAIEKKELEDLLEKDPAVKMLFEEINALHLQLNHLELDEPSMGFEHRLMEQLKTEPLPGKTSALVDQRIIRGIAGFFLVSIMGLLGMAFYQTDWTNATFNLKIPELHWETYFNRPMMLAFLFFDMILGLYFIDHLIRNKKISS